MRNIMRPGAIVGSLVMAVTAVVAMPARAADGPVPAGYRVVAREQLEPGVDHLTLRRDNPPQNVHVARLAPGMSNRLRPVLSSDVMSGPAAGPERTSSMCARVRCLVAVNGDFAGEGGAVVGGMIVRGEVVATFGMPQWQLNLDAAGKASIHDRLDVGVQVTSRDGQGVGVQRVNRPLLGESVNLYSRRWGPSTLTGAETVEVVLGLASADVLPSGVTPIRSVTLRSGGNSTIGHGPGRPGRARCRCPCSVRFRPEGRHGRSFTGRAYACGAVDRRRPSPALRWPARLCPRRGREFHAGSPSPDNGGLYLHR